MDFLTSENCFVKGFVKLLGYADELWVFGIFSYLVGIVTQVIETIQVQILISVYHSSINLGLHGGIEFDKPVSEFLTGFDDIFEEFLAVDEFQVAIESVGYASRNADVRSLHDPYDQSVR